MTCVFEASVELPASSTEAFAWHARPGALERLVPPWQNVRVTRKTGGIDDGGQVELSVPLGLLRMRWLAEHRDFVDGRSFTDVQIRGPFRRWIHTHTVEARGADRCALTDRVEYSLPGGALGNLAGGGAVRRMLPRMFGYRHRVTAGDLALHHRFRDRPRLRVAITGASGLVGTALTALLTTGGHTVVRFVRRAPRDDAEVSWSTEAGVLDPERLDGVDAVVHLAGENIASGFWTRAKKQRIRDSRVEGTRRLVRSLAEMERPPGVFVGASAIGFYGDRGADRLTERTPAGTGFLAEVGQAWEAAAAPLEQAGVRVVNARIGVVLTPRGGLLGRVLLPARLGIASVFGAGDQYVSWIAIDDLLGGLTHALLDDSLRGPVNLTAPTPITQRAFAKTLGRVLRRPAIGRVPAWVMRTVAGDLADEVMLASTRVEPERLLAAGYRFRTADLESALRHMLGRTEART